MMTPRRMTGELEKRMDGPHSEDHTVQAAFLAAEAIRFLNYATGSHAAHGLPWPATAYDVTGNLKVAADRLPQCFDQLFRKLSLDYAAGLLGDSTGQQETVRKAVFAYMEDMTRAASLARQLAETLADAQAAIADVNGRGPSRPVEDL